LRSRLTSPPSKGEGQSEGVVAVKVDPTLRALNDDPRVDTRRHEKIAKTRGGGRNTESFDPASTLVRPDMRIVFGPNKPEFGRSHSHDDVIVVPNFFCQEDDWSLYYQLIEEMRSVQAEGKVRGSEWISWHEGAHLISKNPTGSKTFQMVQDKVHSTEIPLLRRVFIISFFVVSQIAAYFGIAQKSVGTRFNWYRDSSDWKPFHHDSAAFNAQRAQNQNITVGVSFGATRELAFLHASNGSKVYFPQTNGMLFAFGRDVNILWKHGVNALPEDQQDGKGRISIILWGQAPNALDEPNSPPMLTDNTRGNGYSVHAEKEKEPCRDFARGQCSRGASCRWAH
jgi:hypothetical protein